MDVFENPIEVKERIGYLPENVPLYPELTVEEYLRFVAQIKGVSAADMPAALERIVAKCGLESVRNRLIRQLSKGFRQRVGLAQALVHDPEVIVLDEPTIGLDPAQIREVRELIRGLGRDHTIILSSHILPEVSQVCDRVLIINKGRILTEDTPANLTRAARGKARAGADRRRGRRGGARTRWPPNWPEATIPSSRPTKRASGRPRWPSTWSRTGRHWPAGSSARGWTSTKCTCAGRPSRMSSWS